MKVYIGSDPREPDAVRVAWQSLRRCGGIEAELLCADKLRDAGLLWRITDHRGGQAYDLISNAKKSTAFAVSRFLTPLLCQSGFGLFADCDVVFLRDPREMLQEIDPGKAVYVVRHNYEPKPQKMDGQANETYPMKNASSVMLWDCSHPANRRLSLHDVNTRPGRDLHRFYFLHDSEIGALDPAWNWLVGDEPKPENLGIAHFTNGTPNMPGRQDTPHADIWFKAQRETK